MKIFTEVNDLDDSILYDIADSHWRHAVKGDFADDSPGKMDYHRSMRAEFKKSVKLLMELYFAGAVETITGLPAPQEIDAMDSTRLLELSIFLEQNYFPKIDLS